MNKCFLALLAAASLLPAQTLDKHDREFGMSALHASRKLFLDSVAGLSPAQWTYKASPTSWSIAECAEHIALSEEMIFQLATKKILESPATPEKAAEVKGKEELILQKITDRSHKAQAPEMLKPSGRFKTPAEAVAFFKKLRDEHIAYLNTTEDPLRVHFMPSAFGQQDAYQWIIYMSGHTERHTLQILEVKASPDYPKS
jgi:hypothetical protein